jgi:putative transposase
MLATSLRRMPYPTDLSEREWARIEPIIPPPRRRRRTVNLREVVNAITYRLATDCAWRALPADLPPWQTVHDYFRGWQRDGTLDAIRAILSETDISSSFADGSAALGARQGSILARGPQP